MRYEIKPLNLSGILDQGIALLRNHFGLLVGITMVLYVPVQLVQALVTYILTPEMLDPASIARGLDDKVLILFGSISLVFVVVTVLFVWPLTNAAVLWAVSRKYLGQTASVGASLRAALGVLVSLVGAMILAGILIILGFLFLIIPGIYLSFRYWFISQVVVLENLRGGAALRRSGELMKGNYGTAFVLGLLLAIIGGLIGAIAGLIPHPLVSMVVQAFIHAVLMVFGAAVSVVFYYSNRCKLENFDLTVLAEAFDIKPEDKEGPLARDSGSDGPSVS